MFSEKSGFTVNNFEINFSGDVIAENMNSMT